MSAAHSFSADEFAPLDLILSDYLRTQRNAFRRTMWPAWQLRAQSLLAQAGSPRRALGRAPPASLTLGHALGGP